VILAGDVGGTKANLALFEARGERLIEHRARRFESRAYPDLVHLVREFLGGGSEPIGRVGFGVAGPVIDGRCEAVNLSWTVDVRDFADLLPGVPVLLVNDLVATAAGVLDLAPEQTATLRAGRPDERGTRAVIAPGTGLGEAILFWNDGAYHAMPCEAGHADFAPRNEEEIALLRYLLGRGPRVTYEHVISGPGLGRIYEFLRDSGRAAEPEWLARELAEAPDRNAAISRAALAGRAEICARALDRWLAVLGTEAGNLALRVLARGGVYLAGGIVVDLVDRLRGGPFLEAFLAKQPLEELAAAVPVRVVLEERTALLGAARLAERALPARAAAR
jgi:glucokinase